MPPLQSLLNDRSAEEVRDASLKFGRLEGKRCTCHGFKLLRRITCDQDSGLFSVLAHAWPHGWSDSDWQSQGETESGPSCQDDVCDVSQKTAAKDRVAPNFAYILQAHP
ncbi:hypothetical protein EGW08_011574, partial [Elysia chlorotica]